MQALLLGKEAAVFLAYTRKTLALCPIQPL